MRISFEIPDWLYYFAKKYAAQVGVETEEFLYSALCHSMEEFIGKMQENWVEIKRGEKLVHA